VFQTCRLCVCAVGSGMALGVARSMLQSNPALAPCSASGVRWGARLDTGALSSSRARAGRVLTSFLVRLVRAPRARSDVRRELVVHAMPLERVGEPIVARPMHEPGLVPDQLRLLVQLLIVRLGRARGDTFMPDAREGGEGAARFAPSSGRPGACRATSSGCTSSPMRARAPPSIA
jgi:hypothetical protein